MECLFLPSVLEKKEKIREWTYLPKYFAECGAVLWESWFEAWGHLEPWADPLETNPRNAKAEMPFFFLSGGRGRWGPSSGQLLPHWVKNYLH